MEKAGGNTEIDHTARVHRPGAAAVSGGDIENTFKEPDQEIFSSENFEPSARNHRLEPEFASNPDYTPYSIFCQAGVKPESSQRVKCFLYF